MENVCLSVDDDSNMYAVGSKANTSLLDARTLQVYTDLLCGHSFEVGGCSNLENGEATDKNEKGTTNKNQFF